MKKMLVGWWWRAAGLAMLAVMAAVGLEAVWLAFSFMTAERIPVVFRILNAAAILWAGAVLMLAAFHAVLACADKLDR